MTNLAAVATQENALDRGNLVSAGDAGISDTLAAALKLYAGSLRSMEAAPSDRYAFTVRGTQNDGHWTLAPSGRSLRYDAIVTLGALRRFPAMPVLPGGRTAREYCARLVATVERTDANTGDLALVVWAAALAGLPDAERLLAAKLRTPARTRGDLPTVEAAWALLASCAVRDRSAAQPLADRLVSALRPGSPLFPHLLSPTVGPAWRAHVACFADQVYPIQALSAYHGTFGHPRALAAADAAARRICALQGESGQWWWHYDARDASLIEEYPVYSVHQVSMAPMALLGLREAGGSDLLENVRRGLRWQAVPTEPGQPRLVDPPAGIVWRSVRRREPLNKLVRGVRTATTSLRPGIRLGRLDSAFRPTAIDRECRPYEAGWAFFTWEASFLADAASPDAASPDPASSRGLKS